MPVYNKFSSVRLNNYTEIEVFGDGSITIEVADSNGNDIEVEFTLNQLKTLVKEAESRKELFKKL